MSKPLIQSISDTARWVATYRADETARSDALFRDPFAERLAGARGREIAQAMQGTNKMSWPFVFRTLLFDRYILDLVSEGVDLVVNLAAGLDARPYRLPLPPTLQWVEVDLPPLLAEKEAILAKEKPVCRLERVPLDLADLTARRALFERVGAGRRNGLILTEGFIIYLDRVSVGTLASDLASVPAFRHWVTDLASPGLLSMLQRGWAKDLAEAGSPLLFAPMEGLDYFQTYGWKEGSRQSVFRTAARAKRVPWPFRLLAHLPEKRRPGRQVWSGVCHLIRESS
jgi:methyltransferase (TIGR00027 family)